MKIIFVAASVSFMGIFVVVKHCRIVPPEGNLNLSKSTMKKRMNDCETEIYCWTKCAVSQIFFSKRQTWPLYWSFSPGLLSTVRLLLLLGELERSETTTLMPAVGLRLPPRDDDSLLSEPSDVLERVSDDFLSFPLRKKVLILLRRASPPSSSS